MLYLNIILEFKLCCVPNTHVQKFRFFYVKSLDPPLVDNVVPGLFLEYVIIWAV